MRRPFHGAVFLHNFIIISILRYPLHSQKKQQKLTFLIQHTVYMIKMISVKVLTSVVSPGREESVESCRCASYSLPTVIRTCH